MNKEKIVYDEKTLPERCCKHYKELTYDFSNYYFKKNIWKKEYIEHFGDLPTGIEKTQRKIPILVNAISKEIFKSLPAKGKIVDVPKNNQRYYRVEYAPSLHCAVVECWIVNASDYTIEKEQFYYIDQRKSVIDVNVNLYDDSYKIVDSKSHAQFIEWLCMGKCLCKNVEKMFSDAFKNLFPVAFVGGNNYCFIRSPWTLRFFLEQKEVMKKSGPKQNKIDELCAIDLQQPKIENYDCTESYWHKTDVTLVASRLSEEYAVLRWFKKDSLNKKSYETARLFVSKKEALFCRINSFGEFIYMNGKCNGSNFASNEYIEDSKDVFNGTKLEYFQSCVNDINEVKNKGMLLWLFTYYPIAEKMWKMPEYKQIPLNFIKNNNWQNFGHVLDYNFGKVDVNAKNINKAIGVNAYQAAKMNEKDDSTGYSKKNYIRIIKNGLKMDNISFIDNDTYDALCKLVDSMNSYRHWDLLYYLYKNYSLKAIVRVAEDFEKIKPCNYNPTQRMGSYDGQPMCIYYDYIKMVDKLNDPNNFKPYFKTREDIKQMHDAAMAIYNLKQDTIKAESFAKYSSKWKKWEYDKNTSFVVIAPIRPNDLAKEGMTLHHCVKSYIDRVAEGKTNIMFIRKKADIEEPFFTVEVSNEGVVEQVHGFGNRNAGSEPNIEEFVLEWTKACKLKVNKYNKVR